MTPDQKSRLTALWPLMQEAARKKVKQNEYSRAMWFCAGLHEFLIGAGDSLFTAEEWISIAEKAVGEKEDE